MNNFQIKGNWNQIKERLKQKFADLTDEDLHFVEGNLDDLLARLQRRLGKSKEQLLREIEDAQHAVRGMAEDAVESGEKYLRANPIPVILGALILGVALGALLTPRRRREPDPVHAIRDWLEKTLEDFSKQWPKVKKQAHAFQEDLVNEAENLGKKLQSLRA
jgi:uncharacterized protein YjbJ (UPF0337 family)